MKSFIYFIKPIGMDGPIKIGFSSEPTNRLLAFSTWSPFPLEIIGSVHGRLADETFLHQCFSHLHTHREWFLSSRELRETITAILNAGSVDVVRETLTPRSDIRNISWKRRSDESKRKTSYKMRICWAERRLREERPDGAWHSPDSVEDIIQRWDGDRHQGLQPQCPTEEEFAHIEQYLADPASHAVLPRWQRQHS